MWVKYHIFDIFHITYLVWPMMWKMSHIWYFTHMYDIFVTYVIFGYITYVIFCYITYMIMVQIAPPGNRINTTMKILNPTLQNVDCWENSGSHEKKFANSARSTEDSRPGVGKHFLKFPKKTESFLNIFSVLM